MATLCDVREMLHDLTSDSNSDCDSVGGTNGWSADSDGSSGEAPFVHSPYSFYSNSSTPNSMSSLGYEISHIPRFPEYFGPAPIEDLAPNKPPQKHKNRKQRLPVVEKQLEDLQTKTEGAEDDTCKNGTHGTPCGHQSSWKRLRAKRGYAYFVCYYCGAKWRTLLRGEQQ
eukprot:EG_transcript_27921